MPANERPHPLIGGWLTATGKRSFGLRGPATGSPVANPFPQTSFLGTVASQVRVNTRVSSS